MVRVFVDIPHGQPNIDLRIPATFILREYRATVEPAFSKVDKSLYLVTCCH
jgi:hypothetical protein